MFSIAIVAGVTSVYNLILDITQGRLIQPSVAQPLPPFQNPLPSGVNPAAPFDASPSALTDNPWKNVQVVRTLQGHSGTIDAIAFSPDNKILISGGGDNDANLKFWLLQTGKEIETLRAQRIGISDLAMSPDGKISR
jgi:WD40 repeat protein